MRWGVVVFAIAGCGRLAFDPTGRIDDGGTTDGGTPGDGDFTTSHLVYAKASNTRGGAGFGGAVALSSDGMTLAVGATGESSAATGIGGSQTDTSASQAGAVYVYARAGAAWSQQAYVKASNTRANAWFGSAIALSADGNTLAVASEQESSAATGINGNQASTAANLSGAVYVYTRTGATWSQQAYVKASNTRAGASFGGALALSADGNTLAVGAVEDISGATGINGNQADTSAAGAGAVYVFTRSTAAWSQQAYVKASNSRNGGFFGSAVALSGDGNTLVVGSMGENSRSTGVDGSQAPSSDLDDGAAYAFTRVGTTWSQQAYIKSSNTSDSAEFGSTIALSTDGNTLAVGSFGEHSASSGVDSAQMNGNLIGAGAAYVFTRTGATWSQQSYIKATNTRDDADFGVGIALSGDGSTLVVGAPGETSSATGIDGNQADTNATNSGASYVYTRTGTTWSASSYIKASNTRTNANFGYSVGLSGDGGTLAVGSFGESSAAVGIDGDQADTSAPSAGSVYIYE